MFSPYLFIFPRVSISLFTLLICFYMFSTFSIRILTILITVILNSLSNNPDKCIIFDLGSVDCFISPDCIFLLLACLVIFCWKLDVVLERGTTLKQFFSVKIYVNLLEVGLFLVFAEATGDQSFKLLWCPCFFVSVFTTLGFPKYSCS